MVYYYYYYFNPVNHLDTFLNCLNILERIFDFYVSETAL